MDDAPRIGSLFTGYGGLDSAALALLGPQAHIAWHAEIKPAACTLLEHRDPGVPNLGDITKLDPATTPPVDALTFGWPCQPHSSAGERLGEKDPRALWPEVARLVAGLRPRHLLGENVARVCSNGELRRVVATLAELGYVGTWRTLRASDVGAPHRRDRLFLLAADARRATGGLAGHALGETGAGPAGLGTAEPGGRSGGAPDLTLLPTPAAQNGKGPEARGPRKDGSPRSDRQTKLPNVVLDLLPTPSTRNGNGPDNRGPRAEGGGFDLQTVTLAPDWGRYAAAIARWEQTLGRPAPDPTIANGRAKHGRSLNPALVEWMMGLPAGWVTDVPGLTRTQQLSLLGDGVVPQQAIAAFTELAGRLVPRETCAA